MFEGAAWYVLKHSHIHTTFRDAQVSGYWRVYAFQNPVNTVFLSSTRTVQTGARLGDPSVCDAIYADDEIPIELFVAA